MSRRNLLVRQRGQRHLGLCSAVDDDLFRSQQRTSIAAREESIEPYTTEFRVGVEGSEAFIERTDVKALNADISQREEKGMNCTRRRILIDKPTRIIAQQQEEEDEDESQSVCSAGTGIPSLASINAGSVVTNAGESIHSASYTKSSASTFSRVSSLTSDVTTSSSHDDYYDDSVSLTSNIISEVSMRHKRRTFQLQGIDESKVAETIHCLEPMIMPFNNDQASVDKHRMKWGSSSVASPYSGSSQNISSKQNEFTVCRPSDETYGLRSTGERGSTTQHKLASRNADDSAPVVPPSAAGGLFYSNRATKCTTVDSMPLLPRRQWAQDAVSRSCRTSPASYSSSSSSSTKMNKNRSYHKRRPPAKSSSDHVPFQPRRQGSFGRLDCHERRHEQGLRIG